MTAFELYRQFYKARLGTDWPDFDLSHDWAIKAADERFVSKGVTLTAAQAKQTPTAKGIHQAVQLANYGYQNLYRKSNTTLYNEQGPTLPVIMLALLFDTAGYLSQDEATLLDLDQVFDERDWNATLAAIKALRSGASGVDAAEVRAKALSDARAALAGVR